MPRRVHFLQKAVRGPVRATDQADEEEDRALPQNAGSRQGGRILPHDVAHIPDETPHQPEGAQARPSHHVQASAKRRSSLLLMV